MNGTKIGLLPLYLELYDNAMPEHRAGAEEFVDTISSGLEERDVEVIVAPVCRLKKEFENAIQSLEDEEVQALITLHLAYSPSLESADALAATKLPLIVLDTTPDVRFDSATAPNRIMYNHGIHGVQDMCNLLRRRGKGFTIEAGHWRKSDVLRRVLRHLGGAGAAKAMRSARVGLIGKAFDGMGDFLVPYDTLEKTTGVQTIICDAEAILELLPDDSAVDAELSADREYFDAAGLDDEAHRQSVRAGLAVRRWIEKERLTAFSLNFLSVDKASGLPTVPFLEASKAMSRGIGYAGEGDVLTASFVGALTSISSETTFTEMFCPDWENETIFLSHMGEVNPDVLAGGRRLVEKPFPWTDADDPVVAVGRLKEGRCVFANPAPGPGDTYKLIAIPGAMIGVAGDDKMANTVHGWFKPDVSVPRCLERYSVAGGTHHAALVYGDVLEEVIAFGTMMGWQTEVIS